MADYTTSDLLSDQEISFDAEADNTEAVSQEETTGEVETEAAGQETETESVEAEQDATPVSEQSTSTEDEPWTKTAYLSEKQKRQERDARIAELEKQLAERNQESEKPSWFDDPDAAAATLAHQQQQAIFQAKAEMGRELMMDRHEDFSEMEKKFFEMANENPQLGVELTKASNPARFAYETAKKAAKYESLQDVDAYEAKIRSEIEAKVRAEYEAGAKKQDAKKAAITPSLATAASRGALTSDGYSGEPTLKEILS